MPSTCLKALLTIIVTSLASVPLRADGSGFSQIVLTFLKQKTYDYTYNKAENSLEILLKDTSPDELEPLYSYDENFVKRVFFTVKDANNTEVKVVLKDRNVRATIYDFSEPHRIVMDFYHKGYQDSHDPDTGLPITKSEPRVNPDTPASSPATQEALSRYKEPAETPIEQNSGNRRRLLQPRPNDFSNPNELVEILEQSASGIGKAWKGFPPYIYRVNITPYKTGTNYEDWVKKNASKALSSGESLAQYAAQLFDFGHETKALVAYQKILHDYPMIFEKHAEHIWRLAETHLGQGNLTLADGYYTSLIEKHPEHPLANFAALRRQDIKTIKYLKDNNATDFKALNTNLASVRDQNLPELRAQKLIRQAFWTSEGKNKTLFEGIPTISPELYVGMEASLPKAENPKTKFLLSTFILNANLKSSERWTEEVAGFTESYFNKFKGNATEPYRSILMQKASDMAHKRLRNLTNEQDYQQAVTTYQTLPEAINTTDDSFDTMNAIAKSLRKTGNGKQAAKAYRQAADATKNPINKFRMYYWEQQSLIAGVKGRRIAQEKKGDFKKSIKTADEKLGKYWSRF
jgi:tetratricopeptide (TPR) repeat protein